MPTSITLTGWKEFETKLANMPKILEAEIGGEVQYAGEYWADLAKNAVVEHSFDTGGLAGSITSKYEGKMVAEVTSAKEYSAYVEWGTKGRANVPGDLSSYAAQFKGKGSGDYYDFLNAILDWVIRKGIANRYSIKTHQPLKINITKPGKGAVAKDDYQRLESTAYAIALSIIRHGIRPHPFFFIQVPLVEKKLFSAVDNILKTEH
jgi:hypothetical protein